MQERRLPPHGEIVCLACGATLNESLASLAALRCHDCFTARTPISADLAPGMTLSNRAGRASRRGGGGSFTPLAA